MRTDSHRSWEDIYASLYVARSDMTGKGLFTPRSIRARTKLGEYEGEVIGLKEARRRARGREIVAIVELQRHAIDATCSKRGFRFMNHSCAPNTYIRCTTSRAEFYALRDIGAGEELTCDYGETQHEGSLACQCGATHCRGSL